MIFKEMNHAQCKSYLLNCEETKQGIIVDPVQEKIDRYLAILAYYNLELKYVLDTHTHADHRSACTELKALTSCQIIRHQMSPQPNVDIHVEDGDSIEVGNLSIEVLHTPGHTPDSISLYTGDRVLTGDVLLIDGTGRSDFAGGDPGIQYDSITRKLFILPDETLVFPGHDYRGNTQSTIGHEKQHNPRIAHRSREEYIETMDNLGLPLPEKIQEVLFTNITEKEDNEINLPSIASLHNVRRVNASELIQLIKQETPPVIIDVRNAEEYSGELGHIPNSRLIPLNQLAEESGKLEDLGQPIVLVCRAGVRSVTAAAILTGLGFTNVRDLEGGMVNWNEENLPVEN